MRLAPTLVLFTAFVLGCDRSSSQQLTPEQKQQVEAARNATIATSERLLGRQLTESEKKCVHVEFTDGRLVGNVSAPLSDTLEKRQAELLREAKKQ